MIHKVHNLFETYVGVVQGLTSHWTHYRSFQRRVFCNGFPSLLWDIWDIYNALLWPSKLQKL